MYRIGSELLKSSKGSAIGIEMEEAKGSGERDVLTVLVGANTDPTLSDDKRLSDEEVLNRKLSFLSARIGAYNRYQRFPYVNLYCM